MRKKRPNQKRLLPHKELFRLSLSKKEQEDAILTMEGIIKEKISLNPNQSYAIYDRSLEKRFKCKISFAHAQCVFGVFEESGFNGDCSEIKTRTQFALKLK